MSSLDVYYIVVQIVGLIVIVLLGLRDISLTRVCVQAAGAGLVINLATQLPEGGPGLCLGMGALPILACVVAGTVHSIAGGVREWQRNGPHTGPLGPKCVQCGYSLKGLESNRCPECGRSFIKPRPKRKAAGFVLDRWRRHAEDGE